jgi:hypothetical protein
VISIYRTLVTPGGALLAARELACEVAFWPARTDGRYVAPNANGVTGSLGRDTWDGAAAAPGHWLDHTPLLGELTEPVDVVYTWVDGSDPAWQQRRRDYQPPAGADPSAGHAARYLSREELRYSLRSIAMFARWVRTIHLVTDAQVPDWLDTTHPQLHLVDHRDLFHDPSVLPVFNSHAIESQLHRIDGLAERYLYFNDDVLLGRPVQPELFFHPHGPAIHFPSPNTVDVGAPDAGDLPSVRSARNSRDLLLRDFGVRVTRRFQHGVHPQLRSVVTELEQRYPDEFARTAAARFRDPQDLAVPSSLAHYYATLTGRSVPGRLDYRFQDLARPDTPRRLDAILRRRPEVFCLNETGSADARDTATVTQLEDFFRTYFPLPSPYERPR